jgi:hypothetical protein
VSEALRLGSLGAWFDLVLWELTSDLCPQQLSEYLAEMEANLAGRVVLMAGSGVDARVQTRVELLPNRCIARPIEPERLARLLEEEVRTPGPSEAFFRPDEPKAGSDRIAGRVFALAVRLMRGEIMEFVDEHGRCWQASATNLDLVEAHSADSRAIVVGSAADVALEVVRRQMRSRSASDSRKGPRSGAA